jgi:3-oxoadipate enol-lactonase
MTATRQDRTPSGLGFSLTGKGPPLVLVHGLLARGAMFEPLVPLLEGDFELVCPDLRGHGASREMPGPYDIERSAADVLELLEHLQIPAAALLGYSHGGPVCQKIARENPARVSRLILACSYACNAASFRESLEAWIFSALARVVDCRTLIGLMIREERAIGGGPPLSAAQVKWLRSVLGCCSRAAALGGAKEMRQFDSRRWLSEIGAPTLVVAGGDDQAVPEHHLQMLTAQIPDVESRVVAGAGHTLVWTHPGELAAILREWLLASRQTARAAGPSATGGGCPDRRRRPASR